MSKIAYSPPEGMRLRVAMKRREFITLVGGALAWPLVARAQQAKRIARIGLFLPPPRNLEVEAFLAGLRDLGWVEGDNIHVEYRDADGDNDRLPALATELVALDVDVLVTATTPGILAAHRATTMIPTVMIVGRRSGDLGPCSQHGSSGRQHHGTNPIRYRTGCQAVGDSRESGSLDDPRRGADATREPPERRAP